MDMGWEHRAPKESRGGFVCPGKEKSVGAVNGALQLPDGTARGRTARCLSKVHSKRMKDSNYRLLKGSLLLGIRKKNHCHHCPTQGQTPRQVVGFPPLEMFIQNVSGKGLSNLLEL